MSELRPMACNPEYTFFSIYTDFADLARKYRTEIEDLCLGKNKYCILYVSKCCEIHMLKMGGSS